MASVTLPATLGDALMDGYSIQPDVTFVRTDLEAGAARVRRRFTSSPTRATVRWLWSTTQFAVFEYWWQNVGTSGAGWFNGRVANGQGVSECELRFLQPWRAEMAAGALWRVSADVEIRARPLMTRSAWDTATGAYVATDYVAAGYFTP